MNFKLSRLFILKSIIFRFLLFYFSFVLLKVIFLRIKFYNNLDVLNFLFKGNIYFFRRIILILFLLIVIIQPIINYFTWSYGIFKDFIEIKYGIFFRRYICIKRENIKYINLYENPLDMIFKIKNVNIYTAGGRVTIPSLNKEQVESFSYVFKDKV